MLSQAVVGQNNLDLKEADVRESAHTLMAAAEERFDCTIEEQSMREIDSGLYIVRLKAEGDECNDAMVFLTSMTVREDEIVFRRLESTDDLPGDPLIFPSPVLVHEVNPETESERTEEQ